MQSPKVFISYCQKDALLAQRLKNDLSRNGCISWQFALSAKAGTDSWDSIYEQIDQSDFFVVLLSKEASVARGVEEEISSAHYHSVNAPDGLPRIIPVILEEGVDIPRKIVRYVRLPFCETTYETGFSALLSAMGIQKSLFDGAFELDITVQSDQEFDPEREVAVFSTSLVENNSEIAQQFATLTAPAREVSGGRFGVFPAKPVIWSEISTRMERQPQFVRRTDYEFLVLFCLRGGCSSGFSMDERIVVKINGCLESKYDYGQDDNLVFHSNTMRLTFDGFQGLSPVPLLSSGKAKGRG